VCRDQVVLVEEGPRVVTEAPEGHEGVLPECVAEAVGQAREPLVGAREVLRAFVERLDRDVARDRVEDPVLEAR
jgi:hypothetical protein